VLAPDPKLKAPNLARWLDHATSAAIRLEHEGALDASLPTHDQLSQLNVLVQLEHLTSYPIVRERVAAGLLHLSAWWFDIAAGTMHAYERSTRSFAVLDRSFAERLLARLDPRAPGTGEAAHLRSEDVVGQDAGSHVA
jgi:carbonic anhydrase